MVSQIVLHEYDDDGWISLFWMTKASVFRSYEFYGPISNTKISDID